jgi:hypothetical protein
VTTLLAIGGFAALFVVFGLFVAGPAGCGNCSCEGDICQRDDDAAARTRST